MAIPQDITMKNLTGTYLLNRHLSDSSQSILKMQSVGWIIRQAVAYSNVTVTLQQYTDAEGPHLDQHQLSTGGIKNFEDRVMDWVWTTKENWIWGTVHGRSRYVKLSEIEDAWLREGWGNECVQGEVVEGFVESEKLGWSAWQIWGFGVVDGERRHVRRILGRKEGHKDERVRMVYDWKEYAEPVAPAEVKA